MRNIQPSLLGYPMRSGLSDALLESKEISTDEELHLEVANDLKGLLSRTPWLMSLHDRAPLPAKFNLKKNPFQSVAVTGSALCAVGASFIYYKGASKYGTRAVIGSIAVNFLQNEMFGISTLYFIRHSLANFKKIYGRFLSAMIFGVLSTLNSTIAAYNVWDKSVLMACITFAGFFCNNVFGIFQSQERLRNALYDKPAARKFLSAKLKELLEDHSELRHMLHKNYSRFTQTTGNISGLGLGAIVATAQVSYICNETDFFRNDAKASAPLALTLAILSDSPAILIGLFNSGLDIGRMVTRFGADSVDNVKNCFKESNLSGYELFYLTMVAPLIIAASYFAYFSSATSKGLYEGYCPDFGAVFNPIFSFCIDEGAILFNAILSALALFSAKDYFKQAYANEDSIHRSRYEVGAMDNWVQTTSGPEVEEFCQQWFPEERADWSKPQSEATSSRLFSIFRPARVADNYQRMEDQDSVALASVRTGNL